MQHLLKNTGSSFNGTYLSFNTKYSNKFKYLKNKSFHLTENTRNKEKIMVYRNLSASIKIAFFAVIYVHLRFLFL